MPPRSPSRTTLWQIIFVLALLAAAGMIMLQVGAFEPPARSHRVTFHVEASGGYALISMRTGDEVLIDSKTVNTPWEREIVLDSGTAVYLTAANPSQTGEVLCALRLDNRDWKQDSIQAPKDGVACAGIVP